VEFNSANKKLRLLVPALCQISGKPDSSTLPILHCGLGFKGEIKIKFIFTKTFVENALFLLYGSPCLI
jgi:hypothetical protein